MKIELITDHQPLFDLRNKYNDEKDRARILNAHFLLADQAHTFDQMVMLAGKVPDDISWNNGKKVLQFQVNDGVPYDPDKLEEYKQENLAQRIHNFVTHIFGIEQIDPRTKAEELFEYLGSQEATTIDEIMKAIGGETFNQYVDQIEREAADEAAEDTPAARLAKAQDRLNTCTDDLRDLINDIIEIPNQPLLGGIVLKNLEFKDDKKKGMKRDLLAWAKKFNTKQTLEGYHTLLSDPVTKKNWVEGDFATWSNPREIQTLFDRIPQISVELAQIKALKMENPDVVMPEFIAQPKPPAPPPKKKEEPKKDKPPVKASIRTLISRFFSGVWSFLRWCLSFTGLVKA